MSDSKGKAVACRYWKPWPDNFKHILGEGEWVYIDVPNDWAPDDAEMLIPATALEELAAAIETEPGYITRPQAAERIRALLGRAAKVARNG